MGRRRGKKKSGANALLSLPVPTGRAAAQGANNSGVRFLQVPNAYGQSRQTVAANIQSSSKGDGRVVVRHREFIDDIWTTESNVNNGLAVSTYKINPGLHSCFPWLSRMAALYESYLFRYLRFEYVSVVGTSSPGSVVVAFDYDAADPVPNNKGDLITMHGAVRGPIWSPSLSYVCSKSDLNRFGAQRFIRKGDLGANLDVKTYDIGQVHVGTVNVAEAGNFCGELYVEYEVELITPHPDIDLPFEHSAKIVAAGVISKADPYGTVPVITGDRELAVNALKNSVTINEVGEYLLANRYTGTTLVPGFPTLTFPRGSAESKTAFNIVNATATTAENKLGVKVTNAPCQIDFDFNALADTITGLSTLISPMKYSVM